MTPTAHPDIVMLGQFAAGALEAPPRLVIAVHLDACGDCRAAVCAFETFAGAELLAQHPVPLLPTALRDTLARIGREPPRHIHSAGRSSLDVLYPQLSGLSLGRRWRFPNGLWFQKVRTPRHGSWRAIVVGAPGGVAIPEHRHDGHELTCVLSGSLIEDGQTLHAGDFSEGAADRPHRIVVAEPAPGVALIASERPLRWRGAMAPLGRLLGV